MSRVSDRIIVNVDVQGSPQTVTYFQNIIWLVDNGTSNVPVGTYRTVSTLAEVDSYFQTNPDSKTKQQAYAALSNAESVRQVRILNTGASSSTVPATKSSEELDLFISYFQILESSNRSYVWVFPLYETSTLNWFYNPDMIALCETFTENDPWFFVFIAYPDITVGSNVIGWETSYLSKGTAGRKRAIATAPQLTDTVSPDAVLAMKIATQRPTATTIGVKNLDGISIQFPADVLISYSQTEVNIFEAENLNYILLTALSGGIFQTQNRGGKCSAKEYITLLMGTDYLSNLIVLSINTLFAEKNATGRDLRLLDTDLQQVTGVLYNCYLQAVALNYFQANNLPASAPAGNTPSSAVITYIPADQYARDYPDKVAAEIYDGFVMTVEKNKYIKKFIIAVNVVNSVASVTII